LPCYEKDWSCLMLMQSLRLRKVSFSHLVSNEQSSVSHSVMKNCTHVANCSVLPHKRSKFEFIAKINGCILYFTWKKLMGKARESKVSFFLSVFNRFEEGSRWTKIGSPGQFFHKDNEKEV
jgi:hypothetical protein